MYKRVLIVEDNDINRRMLCRFLSTEYDVIEANNGANALNILEREHDSISAVILDLIMPEMDGFTVLREMHKNPDLAFIPVIVATGSDDRETEREALRAGAIDYVAKPYDPEILKNRLRNTIELRVQAAIVNAIRTDALTGVLSRAAFFERAKEMVDAKEPGYYIMACFDVEKFKVINDQYGNSKGDDILKQIAHIFQEDFERVGGIVARIMADNFAVLYPRSFAETTEIKNIRSRASVLDGTIFPLTYSVGRYCVDNTNLEASAMYDRAVIAKNSIKGRFGEHVGIFDEKMRKKILGEQKIISEMDQALEENQFEVWYQPQYNHVTKALIGAEALVRWRHPSKGLISPGIFIPIFEKNGFVYEVDKFVWEQVCIFLRNRLDYKLSVTPISVNISRYDIFRNDCVATIYRLVEKYNIPMDLLRLEITESAFSKSSEQIIAVIKELKELGFLVEIDDFGSGYSSLNTLKDVPADVVKLDMRFLEGEDNSDKGGNILESIVRMARWINMSVIAEGVEEMAQADFLKSIGCYYIQGYLYSKPLPKEEYEVLLDQSPDVEELMHIEAVEKYDNQLFWNPKSLETLIFNSYVGGACIFEYHEGEIEVIRVNEKYVQILTGGKDLDREKFHLSWDCYITPDAMQKSLNYMQAAIQTMQEVKDEMELIGIREDGNSICVAATMRVIAKTGSRYLFYCVLDDITAQRLAEKRERLVSQQLGIILQDMNAAVSAILYGPNNKLVKMAFANERYYEQHGYNPLQYNTEIKNPMDLIYPEDLIRLRQIAEQIRQTHLPFLIKYRIVKRDGSIAWLRGKMSITQLEDYEYPILITITDDITKELETQNKEKENEILMQMILGNIGNGVTATIIEGREVHFLFANDTYYKMLGYTKEQYHNEVADVFDLIVPEERSRVFSEVSTISINEKPLSMEFSVICRDGSIKKNRVVTVNREYQQEEKVIQLSVFEDITEESREDEQRQELLSNIPCGAGIYEYVDEKIKIIYLNKKYWELVGRAAHDVSSMNVMEVVCPDDREYLETVITKALQTGEEQECEIHVLHGCGEYYPFLIRICVQRQKSDRIMLYVIYTSIKEETIAYRQMLPVALNTMMASSNDMSFIKDRAFNYVCASKSFAKMLGFDNPEDIIGKSDFDLFPMNFAETFRIDDSQMMESGNSIVDRVEQMPIKNGDKRYSSTSKYPLCDADGVIIGLYGVARDITDNREAFRHLQLLTDTIPGGLATYDVSPKEIRTVYLSDGVYKITGFESGSYGFNESNPMQFVMQEDREILLSQVDRLVHDNIPIDCLFRIMTQDNKYRWVNFRGIKADENGEHVIINAVMFDVTEQKNASSKLNILEKDNRRRYEHELRLRKELMRDAMLYYQVNLVSGAIEEYESRDRELPVGEQGVLANDFWKENVTPKILPSDLNRVKNLLFLDGLQRAYAKGERSVSAIYRRLLKDQEYHWVKMNAFMIEKPDNGEAIAFLYCVDIDNEWKSHLSLETILYEDVEAVSYVDVKTSMVTIAHMLDEQNFLHLPMEFELEDMSVKVAKECVYEEDKFDYLQFYNVMNLCKKLEKEKSVSIIYQIYRDNELRRKQVKAYYLDEMKDTIVLTRRDVTDFYEEEQRKKNALKEAVLQARQANHAKSDFLSHMSHDIRTPLNAILSFSNDEMIEDADENKLKEYLNKVNQSGEYLLGIINDVLDMSMIEQNSMKLNTEPYSMHEFEGIITNIFGNLCKNKSVEFVLDTQNCKEEMIMADRVRFNQIFVNLLSNAVKFTPKNGKVEFIMEDRPVEKAPTRGMDISKMVMKHFVIRDTGIGMSEKFLEHAFESFSQEYRRDVKEKSQGTGLGLSIVKNLVNMMNGTIQVESVLNRGTTFTIDLPFVIAKAREKKEKLKSEKGNLLKGVHILLAEDNEINTAIAQELFGKYEAVLDCAENGEIACEKFAESPVGYYEMILMDIQMPVMDGLEATGKIRKMDREDAKTIPIIAMTANAFSEDEKKTREAGMTAHIAKPVNPGVLHKICCSYVRVK